MEPSTSLRDTVLDRLTNGARRSLATLEQRVTFDAGATVLSEGRPAPFLGVVEAGRVALRLRVPGRNEPATIVTIEPGELVGWSAVVAPYRATVDAIATQPTTILAFDAARLRERLATDHDLAADLLPVVLESVAGRLAGSWHQLLDLFAPHETEPW
jgi:CRP-like cAMP-binding protein